MMQPTLFPFLFGQSSQSSNGLPNMIPSTMVQSVFGGLDTMAQTGEPYVKGMAQWQLEAMGLMSRRAQAYLEMPSRLSKCRTPQDLFNEQMRFWQTAFQQYSESSRRLMAASQQMMAMPAAFTQGAAKPPRQRDYINFPEAGAPAAKPSAQISPLNGKGERRVA